MRKIIDSFIFFNEFNLLKLRLNYLFDCVDYFLICESNHTFSGKIKPYYLDDVLAEFSENIRSKIIRLKYEPDIKNHKISDYSNINGLENDCWVLERNQRNFIGNNLSLFSPEDFIMLSDIDEIPNKKFIRDSLTHFNPDDIYVAKCELFYYNFNTFLHNNWLGTIFSSVKAFINREPENLRQSRYFFTVIEQGGWHFSYFLDIGQIKYKIDSFSHQEYNNQEYNNYSNIIESIKNKRYLFDKEYTFTDYSFKKFPEELRSMIVDYFPEKYYTRIFIFGANGMLGAYLTEYLSPKFQVIPITRNEIDLQKDFSLIIEKYDFQPNDVIINAAGIIKQRNYSPEELIRVNSLFPQFLSTLSCNVIHITTDCVFSGKDGGYTEDSLHDCVDEYGKSKSLGENFNLTIIRTSIIGEELENKKSLLEWVRSNKNTSINGYTNHFWNGITCLELSKQIEKIIKTNLYWKGVRHYFSPNIISKYNLVSYINEVYELKNTVIAVEAEYCDRSLDTKYESFVKKEIMDQIIDLKNFNLRGDSPNIMYNFPTINYVSIEESEDRRIELNKAFEKYKLKKIFPHIYARYSKNDHKIIYNGYWANEEIGYWVKSDPYQGAITSHFKAIKEWYETTDEPYAFFCEDDISFETVEYWNFTWEEFFNSLPKDWECIQLSLSRGSYDDPSMFTFFCPNVHLRLRCWDDYSCAAYLITRSHAKNLLDNYYVNDTFVFDYRGIDYDCRETWALCPSVENLIYTIFKQESVFVFPLFVENINLKTTVWKIGENNSNLSNIDKEESKRITDRHEYCYTTITEWWKKEGKFLKISELIDTNLSEFSKTGLDIKNDNIAKNMKNVKILFFGRNSKNEVWEYDFILNDILPRDYAKDSYFLSLEEVRNSSENFDVFVYSARYQNNYPWGYMPTYSEVLECVLKTKPKIVIQLSDEFYFENLQEHNDIANYCELFLRQHHHFNYQYTKNTIQLPLAYCNDTPIKNKSILKVSDRDLNWSFVGTIKSDRLEMIDKFESIENHFVSSSSSKEEMVDIYNRSIFVLSGRGNSSLNCFRLYEASMCGAIPIVVGSSEEIENTFAYEENPPWIFADSWDKAVEKCNDLLNDKDNLQEIQNNLLTWWNSRIHKIQDKVNLVFGKIEREDYSYKLKNFPPINFISVDKSENRRNLLYEKFDKYNLTNIRPHIFEVYNDEDHHYIGESFRELNGIGRGPTTSHLKAIKDWYFDTEEEYAFFCEDDISFETVEYWNFTWEEFFNSLPKDWECVQLCWVREGDMFLFSNNGIKLRHRCWCDWSACAYLIKRSHAKKLISHYYRDGSFNLDFIGNDSHVRPKWAKDPVAETIIFSPLGNPKNSDVNMSSVYGFPLFVEDFYNCESDLLKYDSGNVLVPQRVRNEMSYNTIINWWEMEGKNLTIKDIINL